MDAALFMEVSDAMEQKKIDTRVSAFRQAIDRAYAMPTDAELEKEVENFLKSAKSS